MGRKPDELDMECDEVRVQVPLKPEIIAKVDALAGRMGVGRGRMAAMLLEAGIEDNEWIIRMVTSSVMRPVKCLVQGWTKAKKPKQGTETPDRI